MIPGCFESEYEYRFTEYETENNPHEADFATAQNGAGEQRESSPATIAVDYGGSSGRLWNCDVTRIFHLAH